MLMNILNLWQTLAVLFAAYLIGALPFGVIAAKICGVDIFQIGSGSTGATNVIRACGKAWGLAVLSLDLAKGAAATCLGLLCFPANPWLVVSCGALALVGHSASVFIKFRGGKSAASGMGVLLILGGWKLFLFIAVFVLIVRQLTGYQSTASLLGALLTAILFFVLPSPPPAPYPPAYQLLSLTAAVFVWLKHLPNIKRLLNGTETRITGGNNG
ncbi:glycerol-3-phosphate acyltransferase [Candidatus Termititenax persephonae]|uniref:Glycerol-3-phosphate acyltransferase n=1 Tax=Candidatus Termititenax persephonae TaxID=2218525 RepID=A0A388THX3_9BACT|nr:glycerol-3-phosphate acyltransferase [Candidatus Termititenax persephonae]